MSVPGGIRSPWAVMARVRPHMRSLTPWYAAGFVSLLLTDAGVITIPWLVKEGIDALGRPDAVSAVGRSALLILAVTAVMAVFRFGWRRYLLFSGREIEYRLRRDYLGHLQGMDQRYFQRMHTGDLMSRVANDLMAVREFIGHGMVISVDTILMVGFSLAMMLALSVPLTLWTVAVLPFLGVAIQLIRTRIHERYEAVQAHLSVMSAFVQENFSGIRIIKACAQERLQERAFEALSRDLQEKNMRLALMTSLMTPLLTLVIGVGMGLIIWKGGQAVAAGDMTLGAFVAFFGYVGHLSWPVIGLSWAFNLYQRGTASMERLNQIWDAQPGITDRPGVLDPGPLKGRVTFEGVSYAHEAGRPVLSNLDLDIPEGAFVVLVGPTGAGKSTLLSLIPRLRDAEAGRVLVDGRPVAEVPLSRLRGAVGMVMQEPFLFSETIRGNVTFGKPDAAAEEVAWAVEMAELTETLARFPQGDRTLIGERGVTLSSGQRQRLALARALLPRPQILLLDDALSNVDAVTEEKIIRHLGTLKGRMTVVMASHRLAVAKLADVVVVLEGGRIVEQGRHETLRARGGTYAALCELQELEEQVVA